MTPEEQQRLTNLEKTVAELLGVKNNSFIKNLERRLPAGIQDNSVSLNLTSVSRAVNESGIASYTVAKVPDAKLEVTLQDGSIKYIGIYNS